MVSLADIPKDQRQRLYTVMKEVVQDIDRQSPTFHDYIKPTLEEFTGNIENVKNRIKAQSKNLKINLQKYFKRYFRVLIDSVLMGLLPEFNTNIPSHIEIRKSVFNEAYEVLFNSSFNIKLQRVIEASFKKAEKQLWA
ncbi:MAG: hypothetical protein ACXACA_00755 [Candidatus Ranarchaeia archaeon]